MHGKTRRNETFLQIMVTVHEACAGNDSLQELRLTARYFFMALDARPE